MAVLQVDTNLQVVTVPTPFCGGLVGVSSLSIGGVNGHIVLEPYSQQRYDPQESRHTYLMLLSGRSDVKLRSTIESNMDKLENPEFRQLSYSAFKDPIAGHNYRGYGVLTDSKTEDCFSRKVRVAESLSRPPPLWYIFHGFGCDLHSIDKNLMEAILPFASSLQTSNDILVEHGSMDFLKILASHYSLTEADCQIGFVVGTMIQVCLCTLLLATRN